MANRKNFEAAIEIGGKLDRSLGDSINKASNGFSKLERTGNKAATNIDRKFTYLGAHMKGKFVGSIGRATRAMGGLAAKSVAAVGAVHWLMLDSDLSVISFTILLINISTL